MEENVLSSGVNIGEAELPNWVCPAVKRLSLGRDTGNRRACVCISLLIKLCRNDLGLIHPFGIFVLLPALNDSSSIYKSAHRN